ncbi:hypothetical protein CYMTET_26198, partial [Cymbomonas tetramitiformis]
MLLCNRARSNSPSRRRPSSALNDIGNYNSRGWNNASPQPEVDVGRVELPQTLKPTWRPFSNKWDQGLQTAFDVVIQAEVAPADCELTGKATKQRKPPKTSFKDRWYDSRADDWLPTIASRDRRLSDPDLSFDAAQPTRVEYEPQQRRPHKPPVAPSSRRATATPAGAQGVEKSRGPSPTRQQGASEQTWNNTILLGENFQLHSVRPELAVSLGKSPTRHPMLLEQPAPSSTQRLPPDEISPRGVASSHSRPRPSSAAASCRLPAMMGSRPSSARRPASAREAKAEPSSSSTARRVAAFSDGDGVEGLEDSPYTETLE